MKTCKVRLFDGRVVDAEYLHAHGSHDKCHMMRHEGKIYRAADFKPCAEYPYWCRFIGPTAVLRAIP